ncbi:MAG: glycine--tRNA ligase [Dehalococcoidia bacterium]|nr:glycine--tRNA ligase [Dehalococcoidia bacterium]
MPLLVGEGFRSQTLSGVERGEVGGAANYQSEDIVARTIEHVDLETIVSLAKRRGFVFPGSEIYGGLANAWDYGPVGVELKRNVKEAWWRETVLKRDDVVGLDAAIVMHPRTWEASGHTGNFSDPFQNCPACGRNWRADHLADLLWTSEWWLSLRRALRKADGARQLQRWAEGDGKKAAPNLAVVQKPALTASVATGGAVTVDFDSADEAFLELARKLADSKNGPCPSCGATLSDPAAANLMLSTFLGPVRATATEVYLRPETAQGIFVNFNNVLTATRKKLPFGIAQIGKSFRNEITPGNFTFRTREFEQMELEFFVKPGTDEEWHQRWIDERYEWYIKLGMRRENLRKRKHEKEELSHYSKGTTDLEYKFPWGWAELEGIASRSDYDLTQHTKFSGQKLQYFDEDTKEHITPYVIEPSAGADRGTLAFLCDAYDEEQVPSASGPGEKRVVLHLHPALAPIKAAVLPLSRNEKLTPLAREVYQALKQKGRWPIEFDDAQSIGRRYRRFDELGTPLCVTVDFDSLEDRAVTIRDRDAMTQTRVPIADLETVIQEKLGL